MIPVVAVAELTAAVESSKEKKNLAILRFAIAKAEKEQLISEDDSAVIAEAKALLSNMAFTVFGSDSLAVDHIPTAIQDKFNQIRMMPPSNETGAAAATTTAAAAAPERTMIDEFVHIAKQKLPAKEDYKYWAGDPQPWRNGDDSVVNDPRIIASEEKRKAAAEKDDKAVSYTHLRAHETS